MVIILTRNEELHIARCIRSVRKLADKCIVVDSGSTDRTLEIAKSLGAEIHFNEWKNYATQFNWALTKVPPDARWIMRLDADEVVSDALCEEIDEIIPRLAADVDGILVPRRMAFLRRPIRWGGVFPIKMLRIFRAGRGHCENRWMDEHIIVRGFTTSVSSELLDDNRNSLTWWTEKHNHYASREVVDLLNLKYRFVPFETVSDLRGGGEVGVKRWLKENIYSRLPGGFRALIYFLYRYFIRLGFLDGKEGASFHFLQGFWYRYLVDAKRSEVQRMIDENKMQPIDAIEKILHIKVK